MPKKKKNTLEIINIIMLSIFSLIFFSCSNKVNSGKDFNEISNNENIAYIEFLIDDTLEVNKDYKVGLRFTHNLKDLINKPTTNLRLVDGCIMFSNKETLDENEKKFSEKCDSIFFPKTGVDQSVDLFFHYTSETTGEKTILLELKERNFYNSHSDSIRMLDFNFFETKKIYVK